jgi:hypothetical protein
MGGPLLVPGEYVPQLRVLRQGVVEGQYLPAQNAEYDVDALFQQAFTNYLSAGQFHIFAPKLAPRRGLPK